MAAKYEAAFLFENPNHRQARRQQRGLGVFSKDEIAFRPFEHQLREALRQRLVDFCEEIAGRGKRVSQSAPHADGLGTLPRKDKSALHSEGPPPPQHWAKIARMVINPPLPVSRSGIADCERCTHRCTERCTDRSADGCLASTQLPV